MEHGASQHAEQGAVHNTVQMQYAVQYVIAVQGAVNAILMRCTMEHFRQMGEAHGAVPMRVRAHNHNPGVCCTLVHPIIPSSELKDLMKQTCTCSTHTATAHLVVLHVLKHLDRHDAVIAPRCLEVHHVGRDDLQVGQPTCCCLGQDELALREGAGVRGARQELVERQVLSLHGMDVEGRWQVVANSFSRVWEGLGAPKGLLHLQTSDIRQWQAALLMTAAL